jgi:hypothetical protein
VFDIIMDNKTKIFCIVEYCAVTPMQGKNMWLSEYCIVCSGQKDEKRDACSSLCSGKKR